MKTLELCASGNSTLESFQAYFEVSDSDANLVLLSLLKLSSLIE
jgi:hypothetical protein